MKRGGAAAVVLVVGVLCTVFVFSWDWNKKTDSSSNSRRMG